MELPEKWETQFKQLFKQFDDPNEIKYEVLGQLQAGIKPQKILEDLESKKIGWESCMYTKFQNERRQKDYLIENPPEMKEGELPCPKCKQKKTIVLELQTRSCDEGFTYEIHCFNPECKYVKRNF